MASRFVDEVQIRVAAGNGGTGCMSFRREKYIPKGGPDGGDGGRGGSVYFEASHDVQTLLDYRYQRNYQAPAGEKGHGAQCYGRSGDDIVLKVPVGTRILSSDGVIDLDLVTPNQRVLVARGGKGGLGNLHFKSSVNQAPRQFTPGEPGEVFDLHLELKVLSDLGLVGFPNAGKSSLLNAVTAAHSKVGAYPFTTLAPHLGVLAGDPPLVMSDIPGLIEGAHQGAGLGIQFLKHISRSYCLVFVLSFDEKLSLSRQFGKLLDEVGAYDRHLLDRPRIIVVNKADLLESTEVPDEQKDLWRAEWQGFQTTSDSAVLISALSGEGLENFVSECHQTITRRVSDDALKEPQRLVS